MTSWRAFWAAMAIWSFLGWIYIITRLLMYPDIAFGDMFIDGIPITFWMIGIVFFILGFLGTLGAFKHGP